MAIPETKRCPRCELVKPASEFSQIARNGKPALKSRCKACASTEMTAWRKANPDTYNAYFRNRRATDPAFKKRGVQYIKDWQDRNPERVLARGSRWAKKHPNSIKAKNDRRRARQLNAPVNDFTPEQWQARLIEFNYHCGYCLAPLEGDTASRDHMWPLSRGGSHTNENVIPACRSCNSRKGAKTLLEFLQFSDRQSARIVA